MYLDKLWVVVVVVGDGLIMAVTTRWQ